MPKTKVRKRGTGRPAHTAGVSRHKGKAANRVLHSTTSTIESDARRGVTVSTQQARGGYQGLVMPGMVALGCWGLAISFIFFTSDPNHLIYGGIAVLMALMWSFSLWLRFSRLRKLQ